VELLDALGDLLNELLGEFFLERLCWLEADVVEQIASCHELGDNVVAGVVLEGLDDLEDVLAVLTSEFFHDFKFLEDLVVVSEGFVDLCFSNDFDGEFHSAVLVLSEGDSAERTGSESSDGNVLLNAAVEEALASKDLLVPLSKGLFGVEVDGSLLG